MLISVKGKIRGEIEEKLISANGWRRGRLTNGPIFVESERSIVSFSLPLEVKEIVGARGKDTIFVAFLRLKRRVFFR